MFSKTMNDLKLKVTRLQKLIEDSTVEDSKVLEIEALLNEIADLEDEECIQLLIQLFNDDYPFDDIMFSIIHVVEKFEDNVYVEKVLSTLPTFAFKSPRWCAIIHMRILNSPSTKVHYRRVLGKASDNQKLSVQKLMQAIANRNEKLARKTRYVLEIL